MKKTSKSTKKKLTKRSPLSTQTLTIAPWTPTPQSRHKKHQSQFEENEHHHKKDGKKTMNKILRSTYHQLLIVSSKYECWMVSL